MTPSPVIYWIRQDLRLRDNPALHRAAELKAPLLPLFIWEELEDDPWLPGAASRYWLHHALERLAEQFSELGSSLTLRRGDPRAILPDLAKQLGSEKIVWNRRYEPAASARDRTVERKLIDQGCDVETFNGRLLREPWDIDGNRDSPMRVFTPYWKRCIRDWEPDKPLPAPSKLPPPPKVSGEKLTALGLLPKGEGGWDAKLDQYWEIGEEAGLRRLQKFANQGGADNYGDARNTLAEQGTSTLSPYLCWGHVSPRQIWWKVHDHLAKGQSSGDLSLKTSSHPFTRQLFWREFSYSMLIHFPHTPDRPLREEFAQFPWKSDEKKLAHWHRGQTGYPIVDAGMNQLWEEGWLHNRARMIVASFLVKDLMIHWQWGARWFWDTLVDADLADNTMGWQWVAGCGADSAPYFRIFNPLSQSERFDRAGHYVRRYLPQLTKLPDGDLHAPWQADEQTLQTSGVQLGKTYPSPMVDHRQTREQALASYAAMRGK